MDADARLAAAAGGVARFLGEAAGVGSESLGQLQAAVKNACLEAFEYLSDEHPVLEVDFTRLPDRIEVALRHSGHAGPAIGLDTIGKFVTDANGGSGISDALSGIDRIQYETKGNVSVTRLTKYINEATPRL